MLPGVKSQHPSIWDITWWWDQTTPIIYIAIINYSSNLLSIIIAKSSRNEFDFTQIIKIDSALIWDSIRNNDIENSGRTVILPATFTGGDRYMHNNYLNAIALVRKFGKPDFLLLWHVIQIGLRLRINYTHAKRLLTEPICVHASSKKSWTQSRKNWKMEYSPL